MCLFDIIDKRYRDVKPTILISNLTKAELKGFLGERSFDRLREGGLWVDFLWESFRGN
jgi:DNA replication protein DnaC